MNQDLHLSWFPRSTTFNTVIQYKPFISDLRFLFYILKGGFSTSLDWVWVYSTVKGKSPHTYPAIFLPETKIHWHQEDIPKYPGTALGAPSSRCRRRRSRSRGERRASQAKSAPQEAWKPQNFEKCQCTWPKPAIFSLVHDLPWCKRFWLILRLILLIIPQDEHHHLYFAIPRSTAF